MTRAIGELLRKLTTFPRAHGPVPAPTPPAVGGGPGRRALSLLLTIIIVTSAVAMPVLAQTNEVTWSGEVNVNGSPASDGTQYTYDLSDLDAADNYSIDVTGSTHREWDNESASSVGLSSSQSISPAGDMQPDYSDGGDPKIEVTASAPTNTYNPFHVQGDGESNVGRKLAGDTSNDNPIKAEARIEPNYDGKIEEIRPALDSYDGSDYGVTVDVYIVEESPDSTYGEGTKIVDSWDPTWTYGERVTIPVDNPPDVQSGKTYTLEFVSSGSDADGTQDALYVETDSDGASGTWYTSNSGSYSYIADMEIYENQEVNSLSVSDGQGNSASFGSMADGETQIKRLSVDKSAGSLSWSGSGGGSISYSLYMREGTQTVDPCVVANGQQTCHTGPLADGESQSLSTDTAWLESGTNRVNVSVGDGTLSADAPTPQVQLAYSHDAADRITTNYTAEQWTERYNTSHQYSSDRSGAQLRIPFAKEVYDVKNVEMRVNDGSWTTVSDSDYTLEPTNLTVQIGSVTAGDKVEIRATGRKVKVANGDITVSEPSEPGQRLDSQIQVNTWSSDSYIEVPEHKNWQQVHYTYNESWNAESYSIVDDTGYQRVYMPSAVGGDQTRVSTIPIEVMPSNGDVQVEVVDASTTEPQVRVSAGEKIDDEVDYTHIDAKHDTDYILWSITHETVRDSGTANSPLTLSDDDSDEVLEFRIDDNGGDGGGGGGGGFWAESQQTVQQVQPALSPMAISGIFIGLLILSVGYTEWRKRRFSQPVYKRPLVWMAIGIGGFLSILLLNPMAITKPIQTMLSATLPLAGVLGVIGVAAWLYMRQQRKNEEASTPDTVVEIAGQVSSNDSEDSDDGGGWL